MDKSQVSCLKNLLLQKKSAVLNNSHNLKKEQLEGARIQGDDADLAATESHATINLRLQERERVLVQKIDQALGKIGEGSYGLCHDCGEPLTFKRLLARPVATLCLACKEDQEVRERVYC